MILASAWLSHFAILINDVFLLRWQADHLSLHAPESFFNGFFPIGYPLILHAATITGNPVLCMILFQIALAPLYVTLVYRLFVRLFPSISGERWRSAAIALPLVLFAPPVIHAILSAMPDFFAALTVLVGCHFLIRERRWDFLLAGMCVGLGCLFRSHILALLVTISLSILLFQDGRRLRAFTGFCIGAIPFVIIQGLVQVWSGHGFFENAQAFNIWKTMHGMDWSNPPALNQASAISLIGENMGLFVPAVGNWLLRYSFYFIPFVGVLALSVFRVRIGTLAMPRSLVSLAAAALMYLVITAAGVSVSAFTPILPIAAVCVIPLMEYALSGTSLRFRDRTISTVATLVWIASVTGIVIFTMREAARVNDYTNIERMLQLDSRSDAQTPNERALTIYTDDYDFYFPGLQYQAPRNTGGWGEVGLPGYFKEFPHIRNAPAETEHDDLIKNSIAWTIYRTPPYDPQGYESVRSDTSRFRLMFHTPFHEVYRVEEHIGAAVPR